MTSIQMDKKKFQKMLFINNAIEEGWSIKKRNDSYVFTKNHEGKKEIFDEQYLAIFIKDNLNKKLIESVKKKEQECIMIKEETQRVIQENRRVIQENRRIIQENVRLEELGKTYLRTYTNMTIQLLILEEKVAKFEGRSW